MPIQTPKKPPRFENCPCNAKTCASTEAENGAAEGTGSSARARKRAPYTRKANEQRRRAKKNRVFGRFARPAGEQLSSLSTSHIKISRVNWRRANRPRADLSRDRWIQSPEYSLHHEAARRWSAHQDVLRNSPQQPPSQLSAPTPPFRPLATKERRLRFAGRAPGLRATPPCACAPARLIRWSLCGEMRGWPLSPAGLVAVKVLASSCFGLRPRPSISPHTQRGERTDRQTDRQTGRLPAHLLFLLAAIHLESDSRSCQLEGATRREVLANLAKKKTARFFWQACVLLLILTKEIAVLGWGRVGLQGLTPQLNYLR